MQSIDCFVNRRVLVIDDNPAIHEDFRKILTTDSTNEKLAEVEAAFLGESECTGIQFEVHLDSAHQGQEGLEKIVTAVEEERPYAMAFVDMRMPPGWDGLTTIEELWKVDPDLQIVICTAYSDNTWSDICQRLGNTDRLLILKKPFDTAEVCQLSLALTEKWSMTKQARLRQKDLELLVTEKTVQLKEAEASLRQKQKSEAIGSLAGGVAHEFNNLLQVVFGYLQFAMDALPATGQPYKDLREAMEATQHASSITEQLLCFSRRNTPNKSKMEVADVVSSTLKMIRPILSKQIELIVDLCDDTGVIFVDESDISQALLNLCINACDAMPTGGKLRIKTTEAVLEDRRNRTITNEQPNLKPGKYTIISVSDTGCGISAGAIERVFDPFFTTKEVGKGAGMGLAIVYGVLQEHDGLVNVESSEGKGTVFRLFLPIAGESVAQDRQSTEYENIVLPKGNETILLAETEPSVQKVAKRILQEAGYRVMIASDGEEALKMFQEHASTIQLSLLDAVMPRLTGHQVCRRMQEICPSTRAILCAGNDPETSHPDSLEDLELPVIQKPYSKSALLQIVRDTLDAYAATEELASAIT